MTAQTFSHPVQTLHACNVGKGQEQPSRESATERQSKQPNHCNYNSDNKKIWAARVFSQYLLNVKKAVFIYLSLFFTK